MHKSMYRLPENLAAQNYSFICHLHEPKDSVRVLIDLLHRQFIQGVQR